MRRKRYDIVNVDSLLNYYNYSHFVFALVLVLVSLLLALLQALPFTRHLLLLLRFFSFVFLFISVFDLFSLQAVLYSVRWYFNQAEFYRYVPREAKPTVVFAVSGINVDVSEIKHCMTLLYTPFPSSILLFKLRDNVAIVLAISIAIRRVVASGFVN